VQIVFLTATLAGQDEAGFCGRTGGKGKGEIG